jgi:hypothetical protein
MGRCLLLLFFCRRIAASRACSQPFRCGKVAFPPELTEKPRLTQGELRIRELFYRANSTPCFESSRKMQPARILPMMSKLMPRLGGHMHPYRTATTMNEDGAEAVEQEFKP